jgi:ArsR family transcriptional regulator
MTSLIELTVNDRTGGTDTEIKSVTGCCAPPTTLRWAADEAEQLANLLKALAHPVRLQIVELLTRLGGQVCVCDIEAHFDLSQPTISHHLKVLRQAGLIESEPRGVWIYYHTRPAALAQLRGALSSLAGQES